MKKLYENYRNEIYFKIRNKWEFWYTKKINDFFKIKQNIEIRKNRIYKNLEINRIEINQITSCLDYGGDEGQFFPDHLDHDAKFLLDVSNTLYDLEYIKISKVEELQHKVDLVMCCMVLEHVNQPINLFSDLKGVVSMPGGIIYLEVPNDIFKVSKFHSTSFYQSFLKTISKSYFLFIAFDFAGGVYRNFFKRIPFFGIVKQSEHINYFTIKSLRILFENHDLTANVYLSDSSSVGGLNLGTICGISKV